MTKPEREDEPRIEELGNLPEELEPPPELERRVLGALRERGLVISGEAPPAPGRAAATRQPLRRRAPRWAALAAACLIAFTAGWFGRALVLETAPTATDDRPRFLLLLSEPRGGGELAPNELAARVEEYRAWAHGLARRGLLEGADRLEPRAIRLDGAAGDEASVTRGAASETPVTISGFFLIRAGDLGEARRLAETCPHLRHGGRVTVRPIAG